jgi:hypothetical protein
MLDLYIEPRGVIGTDTREKVGGYYEEYILPRL